NIVVLIGGGHAAGKTTAAHSIKNDLQALPGHSANSLQIEVLDMQQYIDRTVTTTLSYAPNSAITVGLKSRILLKPSRFDFHALKTYISSRLARPDPTAPQKLIIVHGLYALYDKELCDMSLFKVYIDSDADTRLVRWIQRDVLPALGNGASLESVINLYLHGAKQEMADYIFQTKERADVIMPRGCEANGIALIVDGLLSYLGSDNVLEHKPINTLRPFAIERWDGDKQKFYELS
ncbi:P-loop containing nucleoside triphosphate hydrolase protein, partial [Metschnikowia bicuspidata var. bicuspidata NRRL YB-4993]